jgi:hypothetical protein
LSNGGLISGAFAEQSAHTGTKLTTAGDLHGYGTSNTRIPIGVNDTVLTADSTETLGLKWAAASGGLWSVLGDYEATGAESTHTFSFTAVDFDDDSELFLVIDGAVTASLSLLIRINGDSSSNYYTSGSRIKGGSETILDINAESSGTLLTNTSLDAADSRFVGTVDIGLMKAATDDVASWRCHILSSAADSQEWLGGNLNVSPQNDIDSITVLTSTSTWKTGTRFSLYKFARA